jgi:hypothetical protein
MILPDRFTTNSTIPAPRKYRLEAYAANGMLSASVTETFVFLWNLVNVGDNFEMSERDRPSKVLVNKERQTNLEEIRASRSTSPRGIRKILRGQRI